MAKLKILTAGDPVLRQTAAEVTKIDKKLIKLLKDMAETMYAADGVGLAAPQIGVSKRIVGGEGCLSVPEYEGEVERAEKVECEFTDRSGKRYLIETDGLLAIAIQHELDHLDGVLFIDKAQSIMPKKKEKLD